MSTYFQNLIPRLKQYGQKLNKLEQLVDRAWVVAETDGQFITYRFLRDNRLLITVNGDVEEGEWNYLPPESLYLKFGNEKRMFSQGIMLNDVLILQKQTTDSIPFVLYDSKLGSLSDLHMFLRKQFAYHNRLKKMGEFYVSQNDDYHITPGDSIYDTDFNLAVVPEVSTEYRVFRLNNGMISEILYLNTFMTDTGPIQLLGSRPRTINIGDTLKSADLVSYRKFKIKKDDSFSNVTVENNIIVDRKHRILQVDVLFCLVLLILIGITYIILQYKQSN